MGCTKINLITANFMFNCSTSFSFDHFSRAHTHTQISAFILFHFILLSKKCYIRIECTSFSNAKTESYEHCHGHGHASTKHKNIEEKNKSIRVVWFHLFDIVIFLYMHIHQPYKCVCACVIYRWLCFVLVLL